MAKLFYIYFLCCPFVLIGQISHNVQLLDNWQNDSLSVNSSQKRYNDCWGFVQNGQEYAVLGSTEGVHFFQITEDSKLTYVDEIPGKFQASTVVHRDIKYHNGYVYAVCDEGISSLQIIDVQFLPDSVVVVNEESDFFTTAHNIFIDRDNNILYSCGSKEQFGFDLHLQIWDISDPLNISLLYTANGSIPYVHDAYVRDNIAYLSCGDQGLRVYDFSNPSNPVYIQNLDVYQNQGYNHQGWMSPDGTKFIFGDENIGLKLKNCSVAPDHTLTVRNYFGTNDENNSVPHNIMLSNEFAFVAYYNEGLRIYDITQSLPQEVGHYDTFGDDPLYKMEGAWGVYSDLPSERILVSDRHSGLYLLDFDRSLFTKTSESDLLVFPNPLAANSEMTLKLSDVEISEFKIEIFDMAGNNVGNISVEGQSYCTFVPQLANGAYSINVSYVNYLGDTQYLRSKFVML